MRRALFVLLFLVALALPARAVDRTFGIGAQLGYAQPTGLTAQLELSPDNTLQFGAGVHLLCGGPFACGGLQVTGDYLKLFPDVIGRRGNVQFTLYAGGGVSLGIGNPFGLGLRVPGGISVRPNAVPVDFYAEVAANLSLMPVVGFGFGGGVGARYWF